ncbi:MAG TPA: type II secretion system protein [Candidatus Saccharimonadales bacterium]|nr:type II secretion system protein [Candidatus Saccharimonadales bacterium]
MLSHIKKRKIQGFTIIEVLIVLAIAGLIMLVVFLAVPALQRNARNTQRTNDVASVLGAINEFVNNNNGLVPDEADVANGTLTISSTTAGTNDVTTKLGYYKNAGDVSIASGAIPATNNTDTDSVIVYRNADCNSIGTIAVGGSSRSIAANYTLEANAKQCKAS